MTTTKKTIKKNTSKINKTAKPVLKEKEIMVDKPVPQSDTYVKSRSISAYRKIALSFIFLTIVLLGVVFYFSFVSLTINITPNKERISDSLILDINNAGNGITETNKNINGLVEQAEISESKEYSATGVEVIGEEVVGKVSIINNYIKNQPLVATTRLLSADNKLYRIKQTVNVPAGGTAEVEIYADKPSEEMVIGPSNFTIPGLWAGMQDKIYGVSKERLVYQKQEKKTILENDINQAVNDLKKVLVEKAKKEIGDSYKGYDKVIYSLDENSISTEFDAKAGEEKEKFIAKAKANINIIAFNNEQAAKIASDKLTSVIPTNKILADFDKGQIVYTVNSIDVARGQSSISLSFDAGMVLNKNAEILDKNKIIGLSKDQLDNYLKSFPEIKSYQIKFSPSFINKVPNLIDRIKVEVND